MVDVPAAFLLYSQFILWRLEPRPGKKDAKVPFNPYTNERIDPHDPANHMDYTTAVTMRAPYPQAGIGFVFTCTDPFVFIDVDSCVTPEGHLTSIGADIYNRFPGAAFEWSTSRTGYHLFVSGAVPEPHLKNNRHLHVECYTEKRFVALTGLAAQGDAGLDHTSALGTFRDAYLATDGVTIDDADWTDAPVAEWSGPADDDELIAMACRATSAASAFNGRASFADLWNGNEDKLAETYTSDTDVFGRSEADAALFSHLAFWTGKDCSRIERIARQSALYRDKWERDDYRRNSILGAVARCGSVYSRPDPGVQREPAATLPPSTAQDDITLEVRTGYQLLTVEQQLDYFKGCVYVIDRHKVYTPDRQFLGPEAFKAAYGGYEFTLSLDNSRPTDNAFKAFTESRAVRFPRAHTTCFRPDRWPSMIIEEEGRLLANTYRPIPVERRVGDPSPFLTLLNRLLPNGSDAVILLSYMAACVQYPGVKFQWAPLVQGVEGNGKSFLGACVSNAVGNSYSHEVNPSDFGGNGSKFTGWLENKLFISMEEIYVSDRREVSDALKPLITNKRVEIQGKGRDQVTGDNRANFFLTSNHLDAIRKTKSDRRYGVFYTAQQTAEDLVRYFPEPNYFPKLYEWACSGGYAVVTEYLSTYAIPDEYNPATQCHRAPRTTSTDAAISFSAGPIEQEIAEAIGDCVQGFNAPWISSIALERLLQDKGRARALPRNKRREVLDALGYTPHPALADGRASSVVPIDGGRPILYVKRGSAEEALTSGPDIVAAYIAAQAAF